MPREISSKVWNSVPHASLYKALYEAKTIRQQRDDIGDNRVEQTMVCHEVAAARLKPVGWNPFRHWLMPSKLRALPRDVHDPAFRHGPSRESGFLGAKTEVRIFEV